MMKLQPVSKCDIEHGIKRGIARLFTVAQVCLLLISYSIGLIVSKTSKKRNTGWDI